MDDAYLMMSCDNHGEMAKCVLKVTFCRWRSKGRRQTVIVLHHTLHSTGSEGLFHRRDA